MKTRILLFLAAVAVSFQAEATCTEQFWNGQFYQRYWRCLSADTPSAPSAGDIRFDTDTGNFKCYNGSWAVCGGYAPVDATYLTQTPNATLTSEQAMSLLGTGITMNTTATGVQSIYGGTSCTNQFPRSLNASGAATCSSVTSTDLNITGTTCTNQFLTALNSTAGGTCTTDTLASAQHANQGTTTTVLHGNAAGNPSWAAVSMSGDVTGILGLANGGTGLDTSATGDDRVLVSAPWAAKALANGALSYATGTNTFSQAGISNLASSTSADLRTVLSDETGTGAAMFGITTTMSDDATCAAYQTVRRNSGDTAWECDSNRYQPTVIRVTSNVTRNAVTFADITGLTFSVAANNTYTVRCNLVYGSAAGTTALQVGLNGPAAPTYWVMGLRYNLSSSTYFSDIQQSVDGYDTATNPVSGSTSAETVDIWLNFQNGANAGTVAFRLASEVALSTVTVYTGSWCEWYNAT